MNIRDHFVNSTDVQTILVTGGLGFIGSALIRHLIKCTNMSVVNIDKQTYAANVESLESIAGSERYHFEKVDICDGTAIGRIFTQYQPNYVMHLAAESHVDRSIDEPSSFITTNILGTYTLLEQARKHWESMPEHRKQSFRFHHISTDEVYGDLPHPDQSAGKLPLFTEQSSYSPSSPYSASKASSDHLVRSWHRTFGLPTVVSNCSNNYGPFHFPEKLIPLTILNAIDQKPLPVYGDGSQIRDWLYVEDHVEALLAVVRRGRAGQTYNIGGYNEMRNIEVVHSICTILDELRPQQQNYEKLITFVQDRPGHDLRYAIDATKIKEELGWQPRETFSSGIRKTVLWYLDNAAWCQNSKQHYNRERLGVHK